MRKWAVGGRSGHQPCPSRSVSGSAHKAQHRQGSFRTAQRSGAAHGQQAGHRDVSPHECPPSGAVASCAHQAFSGPPLSPEGKCCHPGNTHFARTQRHTPAQQDVSTGKTVVTGAQWRFAPACNIRPKWTFQERATRLGNTLPVDNARPVRSWPFPQFAGHEPIVGFDGGDHQSGRSTPTPPLAEVQLRVGGIVVIRLGWGRNEH